MRYLILLSLLLSTVFATEAQSSYRQEYSYCNLTIVRDGYDLIFQDAGGNTVSAYETRGLPDFLPSPDCRFIAANMYLRFSEDAIMYAWDAQTGQEIPNKADYSLFEWSPDSNRLLLENHTGTYLWDFMTGSLHTISSDNINIMYPHPEWSPNRGLLYFSQNAANRAAGVNDETVRAYNWLTGELVAEYTNLASEDIETWYEISADERFLIVFSLHAYPEYQGITVYDLDSGQNWMLDSGTHEFINDYRQIEISPDGRYLVAANRYLWVWELPLLTDGSIEHSPIVYDASEAWIEDFHFISPTVIEVSDSSEFVSRWDVSNGQSVP